MPQSLFLMMKMQAVNSFRKCLIDYYKESGETRYLYQEGQLEVIAPSRRHLDAAKIQKTFCGFFLCYCSFSLFLDWNALYDNPIKGKCGIIL